MEYAIVDIETTGGNASGSRITEIAILIHDGRNIIERFETLVNPEKHIPLPIFALTGIDNDMVRNSPVFGDIAARVFELLRARIFVAHNVNFDYSFVRHQLEEEGYKWTAPKLCTVRMSRKIKPGFHSYSLGKLCDSLDIPIEHRHRAGGDADATAILFSKLLEWDEEEMIPAMLKKNSKEQQLPPNLPKEDFEALPSCPGVYYFTDRIGKVIYVGKAVNIKKRVSSHFTGHSANPQRQHFLRNIHSITFEICATELMALLLECAEIKKLWPIYNRALKRFEPKFGLFCYEDQSGYKRLAVGKINKFVQCVYVCNRQSDSISLLRHLLDEFQLDHRLCYFGQGPARIIESQGNGKEEMLLPPVDAYNGLVDQALAHLAENRPTFALMDKGRDQDEKSCIWVEKGNFFAMGYIANDTDLRIPEDIRDSLTRYHGNHYMMQLIAAHAAKHPHKVMYFDSHCKQ